MHIDKDSQSGKIVRTRREELGLSQQELAEKTGYKSKAVISDIERGRISIPAKKVSDFAHALQLDTFVLQ